MRLWTLQTAAAYESLLTQGVLRCPRHRSDPSWPTAYTYMWEQMLTRLPPPEFDVSEASPIWAYVGPRPDLRGWRRMAVTDGGVRMELRVDPARLLLSHWENWTRGPMNGFPIYTDDAEDEAFFARWDEATASGMSYHGRFAHFEPEARATWAEHVFKRNTDHGGWTQATVWEVLPSDIVRVERFGLRQRS